MSNQKKILIAEENGEIERKEKQLVKKGTDWRLEIEKRKGI